MFSMVLRDYAKSCVVIDVCARHNLFSFPTVIHENARKWSFVFPLLPIKEGAGRRAREAGRSSAMDSCAGKLLTKGPNGLRQALTGRDGRPHFWNMAFDREQVKRKAAELAAKGIFLGTSSWKYEGWFGQLYTPAYYAYRGKVARTRFERDCLREYAEVFKTVSVDAAYYIFPTEKYLTGLADQIGRASCRER